MGESQSQDRRKDYNKAVIYESFPQEAKEIREEVFIREQGFQKEYDEIDHEAVHIVLYDAEIPVATCRIFWNEDMGAYTLGRLAVRKEYRGQNIGSLMLREAENLVRRKNGKELILHAQCRAADFYRKSGFAEFGEVGDEEGCPHVWMRKEI
ncbi:MAG: GNAT family N-acetyltransferase [Roseburia sp.]|nr:GNAT family N-acetyltransferase [Roseburia sp.]MCM1098739.1 GNAT family N-acetyltransferase [Ruminococcus flavefaciens]